MTLELSDPKTQDFFIDAMLDYIDERRAGRDLSLAYSPVLLIGGEDYSDRIPQGDYSQDGIAFTFEALFVGGLPLRLWDFAEVSLSVNLEGKIAPAMRGFTGLVDPEDDGFNDKVTAASAGSLADKVDLNETVTWPGTRPDDAVRGALRRLPYNRGRVRVQPVSEPLLYAAPGHPEGPFADDNKVNALLDKVKEKAPYVYRDTAWGGHDASISPGLAKIPEIPDYLRFGENDLPFWKTPALALERYARVVVFKKNPDGTDAFEPAVANVTPLNPAFPIPFGLTERIPWTGDAQSAQQHAYERAKFLSRGQFKSEPGLPPFVLLERTDVFTVTEVKEEEPGEGFFEREWIHYTDTFEQSWGGGGTSRGEGGGGFQTNPTCSAGLLNEQFVKAPTLALGLLTGGIYPTPTPAVVSGLSWASTTTDFSSTTVTFADA